MTHVGYGSLPEYRCAEQTVTARREPDPYT